MCIWPSHFLERGQLTSHRAFITTATHAVWETRRHTQKYRSSLKEKCPIPQRKKLEKKEGVGGVQALCLCEREGERRRGGKGGSGPFLLP